jgi:hypothetical protein
MNSTDVRPSQATGTAWHQNTAAGAFRPGTPHTAITVGEGYQEHEHRPAPPPGRRRANSRRAARSWNPAAINKIDLTPVPGDLADAPGRDVRQTQPPTGTGRTQEQTSDPSPTGSPRRMPYLGGQRLDQNRASSRAERRVGCVLPPCPPATLCNHRRLHATALRRFPDRRDGQWNSPRQPGHRLPWKRSAGRMTARWSRRRQGSGHGGIWVPVKEAILGVIINERVISEPLHGTAPGTGVPEAVPHWQQVRILLVELVFEPAEGSPALDSACQPAPRRVHRLFRRRSRPCPDTTPRTAADR